MYKASWLIVMAFLPFISCAQPGKPYFPLQPVPAYLDSTGLINDLQFLSSEKLEGRLVGTPGNHQAQAYITHRFETLKLRKPGSSYEQPFPFNGSITGKNFIGIIKGKKYPDVYYVISAHYDHVGKKNGKIYPGTDDNASGTAGLLAMAAYFAKHQPDHSFILAAFDAEEEGLKGSRYFVDHLPVDKKQVVINVNMDMISRNDQQEIYVCGLYHYPFLKPYVDSIQHHAPVHVLTGHDDPAQGHDDWTGQSDQLAFHKNHIPFLYFGVEDHRDYHQPGDTFDKVNKHFYYQVCNTITAAILLLDKSDLKK